MVEIYDDNSLRFSFPEVHEDAVLDVYLCRTLRVPEGTDLQRAEFDSEVLCMEHVADYADTVPETWNKHGGVMVPMYQSEAMKIMFESPFGYPFAVKVASGKRCAITGEEWMDGLMTGERVTRKETINLQNYVVAPKQRWLDGFCTETGVVRQFVAMPLGSGATVEEQLTGNAEIGGIQIQVYPIRSCHYKRVTPRGKRAFSAWTNEATKPLANQPVKATNDFPSVGGWWSVRRQVDEKPKKLPAMAVMHCILPSLNERLEMTKSESVDDANPAPVMEKASVSSINERPSAGTLDNDSSKFKVLNCCMGLGAGGQIKQDIYKDEMGLRTWECGHTSRVFVHLMNAQQWENVTSKPIDRRPLSREQYEQNGLPWSDAYEDAVQGSQNLAQVKPVSQFE